MPVCRVEGSLFSADKSDMRRERNNDVDKSQVFYDVKCYACNATVSQATMYNYGTGTPTYWG